MTQSERDQAIAINHLSTHVVAKKTPTRAEREKREADDTIPSSHRHAGPVAVAPLQRHTPSDRVEPPNPDLTPACLAVATTKTQRAGASPHPPLDSSSLSSPRRRHRTRGPHHFRLSTSCLEFVYKIAIRMMHRVALFPRSSSNS